MKKNILFPLFLSIIFSVSGHSISTLKVNKKDPIRKSILLKSSDGVTVHADLYEHQNKNAPVILLFHQAGYSRGEYRTIAPELNKLGFTCISIDQRSGKQVNGVTNKTFLAAKKLQKKTKYPDALPDLESALNYAKEKYKSSKIIIWGSSYSASLVFILGSKYQKDISGILAFSPGEYFTYEGKKINEFSKTLNIPIYITSAKNEHNSWKKIYEAIPNSNKTYFLPKDNGFHGSKALWKTKIGHENYWNSVRSFLDQFQN